MHTTSVGVKAESLISLTIHIFEQGRAPTLGLIPRIFSLNSKNNHYKDRSQSRSLRKISQPPKLPTLGFVADLRKHRKAGNLLSSICTCAEA